MELKDTEQTEKNIIEKIIYKASLDNLFSLDLCGMNLTIVPSSLLSLQQLEHLYFEGNSIQHLPQDFFVKLGNLLWLDLRNNKLQDIPVCIGQHKKLKTLLLGGNNIEYLPAELGLIQSLSGLNLAGNPLIEPPLDVVQKGVFEVKAYLLKKLGIEGVKLSTSSSDSDSDSLIEEDINMFEAENKTDIIKTQKKGKESNKNAQLRDIDLDTSYSRPYTSGFNSVQLSIDDSKLHSRKPVNGPSWFIHRPWTTGVYFTGSWIKNKSYHSA